METINNKRILKKISGKNMGIITNKIRNIFIKVENM